MRSVLKKHMLTTTELFGRNCRKCGEMPVFADDATYHIETKNREQSNQKVNDAIKKITAFLNENDLIVNQSKTTMIETLVKQKRNKIKGNQPEIKTTKPDGTTKTIKPEETIRLLGINLQQNLSWNSHLQNGPKAILPEMRKKLGQLKFISKEIPGKSKLMLANSMIMSRIIYLIPLWGSTYDTNIKKIQVLLNNVARWISNSGPRTKTLDLMEKCNWLTAAEMITLYSVITMWKIIWHKKPEQLSDKIEVTEEYKILTRKPRLMTCQMGFLWRTSEKWNTLPQNIRDQQITSKLQKTTETPLNKSKRHTESQTTGYKDNQVSQDKQDR